MSASEQAIHDAVCARLGELTPLPDGTYGPEQMQEALGKALEDAKDALAQAHKDAAEADARCIAPHFCRYAFLAYEDERVSVWLLGWPKGNPGTDIHDHGDSNACVAVVSGVVKETLYEAHGTATVRYLSAGECLRIPAEGYIHKFEDGGPGTEGLSLHVYSPPLKRMNYYDTVEGTFRVVGGWEG